MVTDTQPHIIDDLLRICGVCVDTQRSPIRCLRRCPCQAVNTWPESRPIVSKSRRSARRHLAPLDGPLWRPWHMESGRGPKSVRV